MNRVSALIAGPLAVVLWIAGLIVAHGTTDKLSDKATDQQILAWVQHNKNPTLLGGWLFMTGCIAFLWFAGILRARLAETEGGMHTLGTIGFGGAAAAAVFGIGTQSDIASAINDTKISAATAGMFHHLGDLFFVGAELAMIVPLLAVAILAFRTGVVPRWWGVFSALVAVVLWIGPIGWAGLIFGTPLWVVGTTFLLVRRPEARRAATLATA